MNKITLCSGLFLIFIVLGTFRATVPEKRSQDDLFEVIEGRKSVTFIMGEDKTAQPFFELARAHFALDPAEKSDIVVNSCRTLEDVIHYLNGSRERGNLPWSVINIVAHGNPQTGLNLQITNGGHKATPKRLVQAVLKKDLPKLGQNVADTSTHINFWSCGIGKNVLMNMALENIFDTRENGPRVYCSPHFVVFHPGINRPPLRLKASYWPYYYKRGYRPGDIQIASALRRQFPEQDIAWRAAIENKGNSRGGRVYSDEYHIPVKLIRLYKDKDDRPDFTSEEEKVRWALAQPELREQIGETGIPADRFKWTVHKIIHTNADGKRVPAVKAIGMSTVLYVLEENVQ